MSQAYGSMTSTKHTQPRPVAAVKSALALKAWKVLEGGSLNRQKNGLAANAERHTNVTSTLPRTFSRPGMVVSLEESPPLPRTRQPVRAEGGGDVNVPKLLLNDSRSMRGGSMASTNPVSISFKFKATFGKEAAGSSFTAFSSASAVATQPVLIARFPSLSMATLSAGSSSSNIQLANASRTSGLSGKRPSNNSAVLLSP